MRTQIMALALFVILATSCSKTFNEVDIITQTKSGENLPESEIDQWLDIYNKAIDDKTLVFETTEDILNNSSLDKEERKASTDFFR